MPELGFYLSDYDVGEIVELCFEEDGILIPDLKFNEPKYREIKTIKEFIMLRTGVSPNHFFIVSNDYLEDPLEMKPVLKNGVPKYFISQKNGGPTIDLFCPKLYIENGIEIIPPGSISFHSSFWSARRQKMCHPSEALKTFYKKLTESIKATSTIVKSDHRAFLVGQDAMARLAVGAKLGGVFAE